MDANFENFIEIKNDNNKEHYSGPEARIKSEIAWSLLNIKFDNNVPKTDYSEMVLELENEIKEYK